MLCGNCGADNTSADAVCKVCGAPFAGAEQAEPSLMEQAQSPSSAPTLPPPPPGQPAFTTPMSTPGGSKGRGVIIGVVIAAVVLIGAVSAAAVLLIGGSSSPDGVVNGFVSSMMKGNLPSICKYALPSEQCACKATVSQTGTAMGVIHVTGHIGVSQTQVQGNQALVSVVGRICTSISGPMSPGRHCSGNSNPSAGMPKSSSGFQAAFTAAVNSASGGSGNGNFVIPCVKNGGHWYIDFGSSFSGPSGASG